MALRPSRHDIWGEWYKRGGPCWSFGYCSLSPLPQVLDETGAGTGDHFSTNRPISRHLPCVPQSTILHPSFRHLSYTAQATWFLPPNFYRPVLESNSSPFVPYHSSYPILAAQFLPPTSYRSNNNNSKMNATSGSIGVEERPGRSTRERSAVEKFDDENLPQVPVTPKKPKTHAFSPSKKANALAAAITNLGSNGPRSPIYIFPSAFTSGKSKFLRGKFFSFSTRTKGESRNQQKRSYGQDWRSKDSMRNCCTRNSENFITRTRCWRARSQSLKKLLMSNF